MLQQIWCTSPYVSELQVSELQGALQQAFNLVGDHQATYSPYRDMLLEDRQLDLDALAPAFKAKDEPDAPPAPDQSGAAPHGSAAPNGGDGSGGEVEGELFYNVIQ